MDGEYAQSSNEDINAIKLVKGYSRDHRPEVNQVVFVFELICENQAGLPVYMQVLSGNINDAKAFSEVTKRHIHCLKTAQNSRYFIADAAIYIEESIQSLDEQKQKFITRVPMIMTLSLLVYAGLEHKIREQLSNEPEFFSKHG